MLEVVIPSIHMQLDTVLQTGKYSVTHLQESLKAPSKNVFKLSMAEGLFMQTFSFSMSQI